MAGPQQSMPLGDYLVNEHLCSHQQIETALNAQVVYGGKLGTILLEQGAIDLRTLAKALGKIHHVRALDPMQPIRISEQVLEAHAPRLARQHQLLPFAVEGKRLYVLCMDPTNRRALAGLSRATGKEVVPVVLPEVRYRLLLEKYYGVQQELRYLTLARNLAANDGRIPPRPAGAAPEEDLMPEEVFEEQVSQMAHVQETAATGLQVVDRAQLAAEEEEGEEILELTEDEIIPLEEEEGEDWAVYMAEEGAAGELPVDDSIGENPLVPGDEEIFEEELPPELVPIDFQQASKLLAEASDREHIARAVLQLAMGTFKRSVLFIVRQGAVSGWDAVGEGINLPLLKNLIISLRQPSIFQLACETRAHFLGAAPAGEINDGFLKLLGGQRPRSAFLYPILFQGKVVNLIYGDGGPGQNAPVDVSDILIVGPKIPQTFERILQDRKRELRKSSGAAG